MENYKRQQALDNLRNALGRLEQSDFEITLRQGDMGLNIYILDIELNPESLWEINLSTVSNHTLRLKSPE